MSWSTERQCCLNCANWAGERKVNLSKHWESPSSSTTGACRAGHMVNPGATYGSDCRKYVNLPSR